MNNEQTIKELESQVQELISWKNTQIRQQATYPLDIVSKDIVQKDMLIATGQVLTGGNFMGGVGLVCSVNGRYRVLSTVLVRITYSATPATDILTSSNHGLVNNQVIMFNTSLGGSAPGGLVIGIYWYVRNPTTNTFQVSTDPDGPVQDITSAGTGTQYFGKV